MAGGIGSRFWPLSKNSKPKQFLDILGIGKTLLQQTFERFEKICPYENIYIVTNEIYKDLVVEQLPKIAKNQILLEPSRRNTAPCIAYANYKIQKKNPDAKIVVAPSDHLILKEKKFAKTIKEAFNFVEKNKVLLTLGMKPNRPETGYGYIQISKEDNMQSSINKVKTFTEKPDSDLAKVFYESGDFYWNSGIFIWSLKTIMSSFEIHLPEINSLFSQGLDIYNTDKEADFIKKTYSKCRNVSIDYGLMEKAKNVYVFCAEFGWSDLGTWSSLYEHSKKDTKQNAIKGKNILTYDSNKCIVNAPDEKLVVIQGLENYIVVDSEKALLICKKEEEQQIRQFVNDISIKKGDEYI